MLGAFFANERMVHEDGVAPPLSKDMTGMQYIDNLIDQQENFFHKKERLDVEGSPTTTPGWYWLAS